MAPNTFNVATLRFDLADISSEAKQKLPASQLLLKEPRKAKTISLEFPEKEQIIEKSLKNNPDDKKQLLVDAPADGLGTVTVNDIQIQIINNKNLKKKTVGNSRKCRPYTRVQ